MTASGISMRADAQRTEAEFDFIADHAPCAIIEWDAALRVVRWSAGAERLFGWRATEVVGRGFDAWPFVHVDDLPGLRQALTGLLDGNAPRNRLLR